MHVAAYYFPNWHVDPQNEAWHGTRWTEWNLVRAARPRFPGHRQPVVPAWGEFDESDPAWMERQIDLAADHGITTFLFDWYWYAGKPFLHRALENGFMKARNKHRMKFALMWANHDWVNLFPALYTNRPERLAVGAVDPDEFHRVIDYVRATYLADPSYLRIGDRPYFSIYELGTFVRGLGSVDAARAAMQRHPDLHFNAVVWGLNVLPTEVKLTNKEQLLAELPFASSTSYVWVHHANLQKHGFPRSPYAKAFEANAAAWETYRATLPVPYDPNVSMGWDSTPRTVQSCPLEDRGYPWMPILDGNTPAAFEAALRDAKAFAARAGSNMVTLNAWNEWTEGSYLLPDTVHGDAYLQAIKRVFGPGGAPA